MVQCAVHQAKLLQTEIALLLVGHGLPGSAAISYNPMLVFKPC